MTVHLCTLTPSTEAAKLLAKRIGTAVEVKRGFATMNITARMAGQWKGRMLRFNYPVDHDSDVRCMEPRCIRVERVEEKDGSIVIGGHDFATGRDSTFYCESIEDMEGADECPTHRSYSVKLVEVEDVATAETVFEHRSLGAVQAWLGEWMNDPLGLAVVVLPSAEAA